MYFHEPVLAYGHPNCKFWALRPQVSRIIFNFDQKDNCRATEISTSHGHWAVPSILHIQSWRGDQQHLSCPWTKSFLDNVTTAKLPLQWPSHPPPALLGSWKEKVYLRCIFSIYYTFPWWQEKEIQCSVGPFFFLIIHICWKK